MIGDRSIEALYDALGNRAKDLTAIWFHDVLVVLPKEPTSLTEAVVRATLGDAA